MAGSPRAARAAGSASRPARSSSSCRVIGWCTRAARSAGTDATTTANAGSCGTRARRRERSRRPVVRPSVREDDVHDETPPARRARVHAAHRGVHRQRRCKPGHDVVRDRADQRRRLAARPRSRAPTLRPTSKRCRWGLLEHRGGRCAVAVVRGDRRGLQLPRERRVSGSARRPGDDGRVRPRLRATNRATATGRRSRTCPRSRAST